MKKSSVASTSVGLRFEQRLVLHQWLLGLFGVSSFDRLVAKLKAPELEGFDENNVTRFHHQLRLLFDRPELPHDLLLAYDQNIVRHWKRITERRNHAGLFLLSEVLPVPGAARHRAFIFPARRGARFVGGMGA
jgi:hypothetical protein